MCVLCTGVDLRVAAMIHSGNIPFHLDCFSCLIYDPRTLQPTNQRGNLRLHRHGVYVPNLR